MMNKKLKKFLRSPARFFKDMYLKRSNSLAVLTSPKADGKYQYTVISPVHNVGEYLNEYFQSFVSQRLDFKKNIKLILVNDGSTDDSEKIIKDWQLRYPENIKYLNKENGGPGSARNFGLDYLKANWGAFTNFAGPENSGLEQFKENWITFIDPDDFVDLRYFSEIDSFLSRNHNKNIGILNSNIISYDDEKKKFSDTHLLKFRFAGKGVVLPSYKLGRHVNLSVAGVFFPPGLILNSDLRFDERLRPNFEDTHFVSCYIAELNKTNIGYLERAKYYHRKRPQGFLMPHVSWEHPGLYGDTLDYGCLDVFKRFKDLYGSVPEHIQRAVLFNLLWYIKKSLNNAELTDFLTEKERCRFYSNFEELFSYIDPEVILKFELGGCGFFHKIGMLQQFKKISPSSQIAYLEDYDFKKSQVLIRYYTTELSLEAFLVDGKDTIPHVVKTVSRNFAGKTFYLERRIWLPLRKSLAQKTLRIKLGVFDAKISMGKNTYSEGVKASDVVSYFVAQRPRHKITPEYAEAWILMDRDNQADDNAEHMYRYIKNNHPEQSVYFVLSRESHDWERLDAEGYNLLAFGSPEHETALHSCAKIISSHAAQFVTDYFKDKSLSSKHFIFLQHGVIHNDQSSLFAPAWKKFDVFVTSGKGEYESIAGDFGGYKFTTKEVKLTGLPRHDALALSEIKPERIILVMPTWRVYLLGKVISGTERELLPDFIESEYAMRWSSLLNSPRLLELARSHDYKIVFFPHANIQPYLAQFSLPPEVEVLDHSTSSIQDLFLRAALMVTDYSSVAFETAYLKKPVCYYQFDEDDFFRRGHYSKGYFDYRDDGFGPVITEEEDLIDELDHLLNQDAMPDAHYLQRVNDFFPFRDGKCCERVYEAIVSLDKTIDPDMDPENILISYAEAASKVNSWGLAASRWRLTLKYHLSKDGSTIKVINAQLGLACALRQIGRLNEATILLDEISKAIGETQLISNDINERLAIEKAMLRMADYDWVGALEYLQPLQKNIEIQDLIFHCKIEAGEYSDAEEIISVSINKSDSDMSNEVQAWLALAQRDWGRIIEILTGNSEIYARNPRLHLLLVRAYREIGDIVKSISMLKHYEETFSRDRHWFIETIRVKFEKIKTVNFIKSSQVNQVNQANQVIALIKKVYPEGVLGMPVEYGLMQVKAKRLLGDVVVAQQDVEVLQKKVKFSVAVAYESVELAEIQRKWDSASVFWNFLSGHAEYNCYRHVLALRKSGQIEMAYETLIEHWESQSREWKAWDARAELAELLGDYREVAFCLEFMVRNFSTQIPVSSYNRLYQARLMNAVSVGGFDKSVVKAIDVA